MSTAPVQTRSFLDPEPNTRSAAALALIGPLVPVVLTGLLLLWTVFAGMPFGHLTTACLSVVLLQVIPGMVIWRAVRSPRRGWWAEDIVLGFGVGSAVVVIAQIPAGLLGWQWLSAVIMIAITGLLMGLPATRARVLHAQVSPLPWWWGPAVALSFLLSVAPIRSYFRGTPLTWGDGARSVQIDTYLHLALAGQLAHRGPTTFPWVQSEPLGYHWFAHSWIGQVGVTSGAGLDEVLMRFMPVLMIIVLPLSVAVVAVRLTGAAWTGPVAALLTMGTGSANFFGLGLDHSPAVAISPTLAPSIPMLMAAVALLHQRWERTCSRSAVVLLLVLAVTAAGTKGSATPVLVAGLGLAGLAMLVQRNWPMVRQVLYDGIVVCAGLLIALVFVFRGSGAGLRFAPVEAAQGGWAAAILGSDTLLQQVTVTALVTFGAITPAVLGLVLLFHPTWRRHPTAWLLLGCSVGGVLPIAFFVHPGSSQGYFALNTIPLFALAATCALFVIRQTWPPAQQTRLLLVGAAAGLVATAGPRLVLGPAGGSFTRGWVMLAAALLLLVVAAVIVASASPGRRWQAAVAVIGMATVVGGVSVKWDGLRVTPRPVAKSVPAIWPLAATRGQIDAARWIRDHSDRNDVVMTNRHCSRPKPADNGCDSRRWLVTGYSERQLLVEGWTATPRSAKEGPLGRDSITIPYWEPDLLALNDGFIEDPTAQAAEELRERGVRWIFVDHLVEYAETLEPHAALRKQFPGVDVYEFTEPTRD